MSNKDVSIVFKASDQLSGTLKTMRQGVNVLSKDVEGYRKLQQQVFGEKAKVKLDITEAQKSMSELKRAVKNGTEGAREAFLEQQTALEGLNEEYKRLTQLQKEAAKCEKELSTAFSRSSNANAGRGAGSGMQSALSSLAKAGLGSMLGGAAGNLLGGMATSAFGSTIGGAVGNIGSNALSGAAMGSIAGPIGSAVGAAVGGLTGAIQSLVEHQGKLDDVYRTEVKDLYANTISDMEDRVSNGSIWAAEREMYQRNYASMTDDAAGAKLYRDIMHYGDTTPYDTSVMLGKGMEMLSYGIEKEDIMESIRLLGDIAMGDTNKFSGLAYAYAQSMNASALNGQDRRQMVGWGFDPLDFVAKNEGITKAEAMDMMSDGKITSDMLTDALRLATSEGKRYHGAVNATSDTFTGMQGQLESAKKNMDIEMGGAYNETRKRGMAQELDAYNGELGERMKSAYRMVGAYEAEMENQYQQSLIKAMENATKTIEEQGLEGIEAEKVMWEAKTNAEIEYKNSEEMQKKYKAEQDLVTGIQERLTESGEYLQFGRAMADQFSKGWQGGRLSSAASDVRSTIQEGGMGGFINSIFAKGYKGTPGGVSSHATGLPRVPYDGYRAELHEGERVLTKQEAKQYGQSSITIPKLADQIIIREDADIDRIAKAIVASLWLEKAGHVGG